MSALPDRKEEAMRVARAGWGHVVAYAHGLRADVVARLAESEARTGALLMLGLAAIVALFGAAAILFALSTPDVSDIQNVPFAEASIAYTSDGDELTRYHIDENRTWVPLDSISQYVVDALIATEDRRFYKHNGVDVPRMIGAIVGTAGGDTQGGSTLTMQLARNVYTQLKDEPMLVRKIKEWLIALKIEDAHSKDEILEMYMNVVPFMYDAAGIEAAAKTYFQKPASRLDLGESATLIGLLKATAYYNPVRSPERSQERRNVVFAQMVRYGYLDEATFDAMRQKQTPLHFRRISRQENDAPFFAEYLRQWLDTWADARGINLYTDGLRVYTTIDSRLQRAAEEAVSQTAAEMQNVVDVEWASASPFHASNTAAYAAQVDSATAFSYFWQTHDAYLQNVLRSSREYRLLLEQGLSDSAALLRVKADTALVQSLKRGQERIEAGFVAIDPHNGHVRAWVGGRDFGQQEFDHVVQAKRQPGSTFKPFVYAAALENGYAPYSVLADAPFTWVNPYTREVWSPGNFGGTSGELVTLRQALAFSKNTVTARLITSIGADKVVDVAKRMGIESPLQAVPSLGLGTSEVSLLEMTAAYTTLADRGVYHTPISVTRIEDRHGKLLQSFASEERRALEPYTAYAVLDMMRGVIDFGTGVRMRFLFGAKGDLAAKTGTTQNGADGWFMLIHPDLVVGSWMGFYSPSVAFRSPYWGQGAHNALHLVGDFYKRARAADPTLLDPSRRFAAVDPHDWVITARAAEADNLNRRERQKSNLDEILKRLRNKK